VTFQPFTSLSTLLYLPSAAYTSAIPAACTFDTTSIEGLAFDISFTSFSGGTNPTITFMLSRLAADGNYYGILAPAGSNLAGNAPVTFSAAGIASLDIGAFAQDNVAKPNTTDFLGSAHNVFTSQTQVNWTFTGAPASATFSLSVIGRRRVS
jgi:hypothetical protein